MGNLIQVFLDTQNLYMTNTDLVAACTYSRKNQSFIPASEKIACNLNRFASEADLYISKQRSFEAAEHFAKAGEKVAVLNFANSYHPGGGVRHGARAQEECLCRISTLYDAISDPKMKEYFYDPHCKGNDDLANDDIIYTPKVVVFKSDTEQPALRPKEEWFYADVLTCAAPCISWNQAPITKEKLRQLHDSRARHILDCACNHEVDVLVLGAFGCGAFQNPPEIVAKVYKQVLVEYTHAFKSIVFAIYCKDYETENYKTFLNVLGTQAP
ncbi:MAG: TIGR02452 family protein [Treponema sp.]|nr:TIGR02452 family protein [Treponema sp.]